MSLRRSLWDSLSFADETLTGLLIRQERIPAGALKVVP
jgi:hypothetical protein